MSRQDDIAAKAVRKSTLKSISQKKKARLEKLKNDYEQAVRDVNIQFAIDPERLKAKYAAEDYAKTEKARKRAERRIETERKIVEMNNNRRTYSLAENISSAIIQGLGMGMSIAFIAIFDTLAIKSASQFKVLTLVAYTLFGASLTLMYLFSVLYHSIRNITAKEVFSRLSHSFSFMIIGWGYTAYTLTKVQGVAGWVLFGIVWTMAILGIVLYSSLGNRISTFTTILYIVMGSSGLFVAKSLYHALSPTSFRLLISAGIIYLFGLVFYELRKVKFMHFVGNCIWLCSSIIMCLSLFYINM